MIHNTEAQSSKGRRTNKRMCSNCHQAEARFITKRSWNSGGVHRVKVVVAVDDQHDYCPRCYRSARARADAANLS